MKRTLISDRETVSNLGKSNLSNRNDFMNAINNHLVEFEIVHTISWWTFRLGLLNTANKVNVVPTVSKLSTIQKKLPFSISCHLKTALQGRSLT